MAEVEYFTSGAGIFPDSAYGATISAGANNNFGSYAEVVSSTTEDVFVYGLTVSSSDTISIGFRVQIATGSAGSETVRATLWFKTATTASSNNYASMVIPLFVPLRVPSGTRIAIRAANSTTSSRGVTYSLYYIPVAQIVNPVLAEVENPTGSVVSDSGNSASSFKTNLTQTTNDYWKDAFIKLTSGAMSGQVKRITGYNGSTKFITCEPFTSTPAAGVTFEIINQ